MLCPAVLPDSKELDSFLEFTTGQQPGHLECFSSGPVLAEVPSSHSFDKHTSPSSSSSSPSPVCTDITPSSSLNYFVIVLFVIENIHLLHSRGPRAALLYSYLKMPPKTLEQTHPCAVLSSCFSQLITS